MENGIYDKAVTEINNVQSANNIHFELVKVYLKLLKFIWIVLDILDKDAFMEATSTELDSLATNIISLDNNTILCRNESFTCSLQKQGYNSISWMT